MKLPVVEATRLKLEKERKEVLQACLDLVENDFFRSTGMEGNVSRRAADSDLIAITPSQMRYDEMSHEDIVILNTDGEVIEAESSHKPTLETPTHTLIYRKIEDAKAVIHSHPPYSIALSLLFDEIPSVYVNQALFFGTEIPVVDYVPVWSDEMAEAVVPVLKEYSGVIIRSHGIVTIGGSLREALQRTFIIEDNAEIYYKALNLGKPEPLEL